MADLTKGCNRGVMILLLAECDHKACIRGYDAVSLDEAIAILRELADNDETED